MSLRRMAWDSADDVVRCRDYDDQFFSVLFADPAADVRRAEFQYQYDHVPGLRDGVPFEPVRVCERDGRRFSFLYRVIQHGPIPCVQLQDRLLRRSGNEVQEVQRI